MTQSNSDIEPVELLADEFVERQRRGEKPSIEEYVRSHPHLADEIREVFPALAIIEKAAPNSDDAGMVDGSPPLRNLGDYRILREIGRGGMGSSTKPNSNRSDAASR